MAQGVGYLRPALSSEALAERCVQASERPDCLFCCDTFGQPTVSWVTLRKLGRAVAHRVSLLDLQLQAGA